MTSLRGDWNYEKMTLLEAHRFIEDAMGLMVYQSNSSDEPEEYDVDPEYLDAHNVLAEVLAKIWAQIKQKDDEEFLQSMTEEEEAEFFSDDDRYDDDRCEE